MIYFLGAGFAVGIIVAYYQYCERDEYGVEKQYDSWGQEIETLDCSYATGADI